MLGAGSAQVRLDTIGLALGSNVRVGLEDSLWDGPGRLAESSAVQVDRLRTAATVLHRDVATPAERRERLGLKGAATVRMYGMKERS